MKATLEFDCEDMDDRNEHMLAIHGTDFALVCRSVNEWLCHEMNTEGVSDERYKALSECNSVLLTAMDNHGVNLEMVT